MEKSRGLGPLQVGQKYEVETTDYLLSYSRANGIKTPVDNRACTALAIA